MANLKYSDKHNMVAFLKKPNGSDDFHEIVDFLKRTPLRYALTHNPTIYDSLVKQFWQTATVRTIANGNQELLATIDSKAYTITEASVRSSLQLADATGITNLPDAEIHEGLATMGYVSDGTLTFWKKHFTPQWKFLIHTILHCISPKSGGWDQFSSNIATALICLSSNRGPTPTPIADEATTTSVEVDAEGAATTTASLEAGLDSGNIHKSPLRSHDAPLPEVNTSGSAEDSVQLKELMNLVKTLEVALKRKSKKVVLSESEGEEAENSSKQGRKSQDDRSEDFITPSNSGEAQEQDISPTLLDAANTLTQVASGGVSTYKKRRRSFETGMDYFSATKERTKSEEKTKKQLEQEIARFAKVRLQAQLDAKVSKQIYTDEMIAKRMEEETDVTNQQKQRMAQVQFEAQYYIEEDWDVIRAKLEANAELVKNMQGEGLSEEDFAKRMVDMINRRKKYFAEERAKAKRKIKEKFDKLVNQIDTFVPMSLEATKARMKRYNEELQTGTSKKQKAVDDSGSAKLQEKIAAKDIPVTEEKAGETTEDSETDKEEDMEAIGVIPVATKSHSVVNWNIFQQGQRSIYQIIRANGADTIYMSFGAMLKDIKRDDLIELYRTMFESPISEDAIWSLPLQQKMLNWRYYDSCGVHCLTLEAAIIYMLTERKYHLSFDTCQAMLDMKLQGGKQNEECYQLLKFIEKQSKKILP
ncbi:hypothetical protein Tco_0826231 [Tanacetum coccineum]